mgnify:CR=1 FL=1
MFNAEMIAFLGYFIILFFVALFFFFNGGNRNQEDYFLGGRSMGPWVTAMSAQASDMSAWLLMGLPGSIMAFGFGQMWIGIGLALETGFSARQDLGSSLRQREMRLRCRSIFQIVSQRNPTRCRLSVR